MAKYLLYALILCTAYTSAPDENGGYTCTASGEGFIVGRTIACDWLPLWSRVRIEGIGERWVTDRIGNGANNHIDILVGSKTEAHRFGKRYLNVEVIR